MLRFRSSRECAVVVAFTLQCLLCIGTARAQFTGACCFANETCTILSPYDCVQAGGDFLGLCSACPATDACDPLQHFGVGMSQVAARRLLREGVVHTIHMGNSLPLYEADHPIWDLLASGVVIAPEIQVAPGETALLDPEISAEDSAIAAAQLMLDRAEEARAAFACAHPGKPFHWSLHLVGLGNGNTWLLSEDSNMPIFTHHENDVLDGRLRRRQYISQAGRVGGVINSRRFQVLWPWDLFGQFSPSYYLEPWPATVTVQDYNDQNQAVGPSRSALVVEFDKDYRTFLLDDDILLEPVEGGYTDFSISRTDQNYTSLFPCYFFKHGAAEMEAWIVAFCARVAELQFWHPFLPPPAVVFVSDEDIGEASVDWVNYKAYLNDVQGRAEDEDYTIDGERTLREWHDEFAPPEFDEFGNYSAVWPDYSPDNAAAHSYLLATVQTAYNYHREQSTWRHIRELWPRAKLSQYQLGKGYGVTHNSVEYAVPISPGESSSHGVRTWHGPVTWDEYYCGLTLVHSAWDVLGDGQVIPVSYGTGAYAFAEAGDGSMLDPNEVPVQGSLPIDPGHYLDTLELPLFIEFTTPPNSGTIYEVIGWSASVFSLATNLAAPTAASGEFILYYPNNLYTDFTENLVEWPFIETFCNRYGEPINATGFKATAKKWAAESARAQTRALPDNPYSVFYSPGMANGKVNNVESGGYDGVPEKVSFLATYPHPPFESQDGWMDGEDWGEIASRALDYGVNHFVWFMPNLVQACENPMEDDCFSMSALTAAILTLDGHHAANLPVYTNIACIGDWNMDEEITAADVTAFMNDLSNEAPEADLNNDGLFNQDDTDIYNAAFCGGGCAPVAAPGCSNQEDCHLADWNDDDALGVEDIFAFLSDWFAQESDAYNFGGTPGVPAIFAYLSLWFSVGAGPCDP